MVALPTLLYNIVYVQSHPVGFTIHNIMSDLFATDTLGVHVRAVTAPGTVVVVVVMISYIITYNTI